MIPRFIENKILKHIKSNHVVGLFGPRRTGKTYLMNQLVKNFPKADVLVVNGEDLDISEILSSQRLSELIRFVEKKKVLFVDEAQKIPNIGINLKLMVDHIEGLSIMITGSSSLSLKNVTGEPLTGRSTYFNLYPFAQAELNETYLEHKRSLTDKLIYGLYPQVWTASGLDNKKEILMGIRDGFLLRDILELDNNKDATFILKLLRLIAFQIGNTISYNELASNLDVSKKTVQRYLDLLEKSYVLFSLRGLSRNLRKEFAKTPRYYFWDNGIRNAVISNFSSLDLRDDIGRLWENFCISERLKRDAYLKTYCNHYFWRTYDQKEIDLVEECDGNLHGYEFKWKAKTAKPPNLFLETYENSSFEVINTENAFEFLSSK